MNNQKLRIFIITGLVLLLLYVIYRILLFFLVITGAIFIFNPNPPAPQIKYGEFPCRLVYEINGEQKVIEDTIICEFDGFENIGSAGNYRKWKTYLRNEGEMTSDNIVLLNLQNDDIYDEFGHKVLELYFYGGSGHYYMNDELGGHERTAQDFSYIDYKYEFLDGTIGHSAFKAEEAYERFKIKLISWEVAPPIQNEFQ